MKKGDSLKYQWPSILNVVSSDTTDQIKARLNEDPSVIISEKLDGSNISISSQGWVASRRVVIVENFYEDDLSKVRLGGSNLMSLAKIRDNVKAIHSHLQTQTKSTKFQTVLYGEWLQHRTATSQEDMYCYKNRGFEPGSLYAFGIAIVFEDDQNEAELKRIENELCIDLGNEKVEDTKSTIITYGLGLKLQKLFHNYGFATAPLILNCSMKAALVNEELIKQLLDRSIEGLILVGQGFIFKWKTVECQDRTYHAGVIATLRLNETSSSTKNAIDALEKVCLSIVQKSIQPKKRPDRQLYGKLFRSAETKYQRIEDLFSKSMTQDEKSEVLLKTRARLQEEVKIDFIALGYSLNEVYEQEIESFVQSALETRTDNWFKGTRKKKNRNKIQNEPSKE